MGEKDKYGYKHDDGHYSKMTGNDKNCSYSIYDKNPSEKGHSAVHININTDTGKGSVVEHGSDGKTTTTNTGCFLTSACMKHFQESFDDNCYELTVLRWFRDNFVSQEDIAHYYQTAPVIVAGIDNCGGGANIAYDYIYENVVRACVEAIENGDYALAYERYKSSTLALEEQFARKEYQSRLVKAMKTLAIKIV
ncbi:MAG: hypothetical protein PHI22_02945 [Bacilli bacterium]|nr:hypothetical protein [Bacilli bacterium]